MIVDKIVDILQGLAMLALVANDLLMQRRIRILEKRLENIRVDIMAEGIRQALLQYRKEKEAQHEEVS